MVINFHRWSVCRTYHTERSTFHSPVTLCLSFHIGGESLIEITSLAPFRRNLGAAVGKKDNNMTSLPFPYFLHHTPVDAANGRAALSAVGTCRVDPSTCFVETTEFRAICEKNREQALVDTDTPETKSDNEKLKKKFMKQGVAMASTYLQKTLQLDVSVVDVQVVLSSEDVLGTDGCVAACLLDAGCAAIVMDGTNGEAMDAAKIPRERLVAHFADEHQATPDAVSKALVHSGTISVALTSNSLETVDRVLALVPEKKDKVVFIMARYGSDEDMCTSVSAISKKCKDYKGKIGLVDPTPTCLGLCFAACMKTDREDGLYTTVVCTRSDEALGLVYSSKVGTVLGPICSTCASASETMVLIMAFCPHSLS